MPPGFALPGKVRTVSLDKMSLSYRERSVAARFGPERISAHVRQRPCLTVATGRFTLTPALKSNRHATAKIVTQSRYRWAAPGDVNAFFGLMLDNVADVLLMVGLLAGVFGFPTNFAWR